MGKLMKYSGFTDLQSYGAKKLASLLTAAGVGALAGPFGVLGSVAFWIASEIVATLIKVILSKVFSDRFTNIFGESQTCDLIKSIYRYFEIKMRSGLDASLHWMKDYLMPTQDEQKKLA